MHVNNYQDQHTWLGKPIKKSTVGQTFGSLVTYHKVMLFSSPEPHRVHNLAQLKIEW